MLGTSTPLPLFTGLAGRVLAAALLAVASIVFGSGIALGVLISRTFF